MAKYTIQFSEEHFYQVEVEADSVDTAVEQFYATLDPDKWVEVRDSNVDIFHIGKLGDN